MQITACNHCSYNAYLLKLFNHGQAYRGVFSDTEEATLRNRRAPYDPALVSDQGTVSWTSR